MRFISFFYGSGCGYGCVVAMEVAAEGEKYTYSYYKLPLESGEKYRGCLVCGKMVLVERSGAKWCVLACVCVCAFALWGIITLAGINVTHTITPWRQYRGSEMKSSSGNNGEKIGRGENRTEVRRKRLYGNKKTVFSLLRN